MLQNRRRHLLPPSGVAPARELGSASCSVITFDYAGLNSVLSRNIAGMMMASRRASAIRALRMVERFAIANAQSLILRDYLQRVSMTLAASWSSVRTRLSPHFEMLPV